MNDLPKTEKPVEKVVIKVDKCCGCGKSGEQSAQKGWCSKCWKGLEVKR